MKNYLAKFFTIIFILASLNAKAFSPEDKLQDPKLEKRAQTLFLEVRCLVCNGQVIENSSTAFSYDMRKLIRQKISNGQTNEEIKSELVEEFGDDILTSITLKQDRFFLFILPIILLIIGAVFLIKLYKK